ncbi:MAG: Panacea domain-containing protein [Candidatus Poribacteria bacterium]|nr:Panacea domain-containing protein [Candidatus Poribacteria bacterium]
MSDTIMVDTSLLDIPEFNERRTTQVAALLAHYSGGQISVYKLVKLIYLIDRTSLERRGRPVTFDRPYNLPLGPTPSHTYDLVCKPWEGEYWSQYFSRPQGYIIKLIKDDISSDELSQAQIDLINDVFKEFGNKSFGQLKNHLHSLPEFDDPGGSSNPIDWNTLLKATGWSDEDLITIRQEFDAKAKFENMLRNMENDNTR